MTKKEQALAGVLAAMHLRKPQEEALKAFHDVMNTTEMPLSNMAPVDVASLFKAVYPDWHYDGEVQSLHSILLPVWAKQDLSVR